MARKRTYFKEETKMEIKLNGKEAIIVLGATIMNAVIACKALNKADKAKKEAKHYKFMNKCYEFDRELDHIIIKRLVEENKELKSRLEEGSA
jgi:predicted RNase H-like nuclease (RuvC/YqgF family)